MIHFELQRDSFTNTFAEQNCFEVNTLDYTSTTRVLVDFRLIA
jgi:hypothetical protein